MVFHMMQTDSEIWPDEIFQVLNAHCIKQVVYVPDSGHAHLIQRCRESSEINAIALTTEEEGIALLAGVLTFAVDDGSRLKDTVEAATRMAFEGPAATAVLISQQIMGAKTFGK